ncbi:MAG: hypothetical protein AB1918_02140 [Pseudomonadota bacterium]
MSRFLSLALAAAVAAAGALASAPVAADPPPWAGHGKHKHKHKHHHHDDDDDYRVVYVPVPSARETHVYHHRARPVAQLPYGFARGTCDRGLISSEMMGNVLGGVVGGVAGNQVGRGSGRTAAVIGGTIIGVMVGGSVGRSMDGLDQGCVAGALDHLPDQRSIAWAGDSGEHYRVTPVRSWGDGGDRYCREYQATAVVGGRKQQTYGTACRQPDGQWEIVD